MTSGTESNSGGTSEDKTLRLIKIAIAALLGICSVILGVDISELIGGM